VGVLLVSVLLPSLALALALPMFFFHLFFFLFAFPVLLQGPLAADWLLVVLFLGVLHVEEVACAFEDLFSSGFEVFDGEGSHFVCEELHGYDYYY
jgi:hypothetical protein